MSEPEATAPPACSRCHRAEIALVQSPFTAEALCPDCLRRESELLTRLRSTGSDHQAIACDHTSAPMPHPDADPAQAAVASKGQ